MLKPSTHYAFWELTACQQNLLMRCSLPSSLPSWHCPVTAADRQETTGNHLAFCTHRPLFTTQKPLTTLIQDADDKLFHHMLCNSHHVLYSLLPPKSDNNCDLRKNRPHERTLVSKTSLTECDYRLSCAWFSKTSANFISVIWLPYFYFYLFYVLLYVAAVWWCWCWCWWWWWWWWIN